MTGFNTLIISVTAILLLSFLIQLLYYWIFFARLAFFKQKEEVSDKDSQPVSVVIAAHNEYYSLKKNLPSILEQDYPNFEVVVVNHASNDETASLLKELNQKHDRLKVITIERDLNFFHGKKFPLSIGIKSAAHDLLLLTDADCKPDSPQWIQRVATNYDKNTEVVLGYGPYETEKGFLNKLVRYDTFIVAMQYLSFAMRGLPYMGVGRNLSYRKELFFKQKGFVSHYRIASGDDDLFIGAVARKGNTKVELAPESFVYSEPKHSFKAWRTQKRRHMTTGKEYKKKFKLLLGTYGLSLIVFYLALLFLLIFWQFPYSFIALGALLLRIITQIIIHKNTLNRLNEKHLLLFSLLWEPVHLMVIPLIGITGFRSKDVKWE
jgi:cellulose synthase/poly-beta-1,6-N-acetylglucosamine synthase-like glycosyltransferase